MNERRGYFFLCLVLWLVSFGAVGASAQGQEYAQNLFAPVLQSTAAGDLGIALSNPTLSPVSVIVTARSYTGDVITGVGITNPVIMTLAPSAQRALTAGELFGSGITGQTGWISFQSPSTAISGLYLLFDGALTNIDGAELTSSRQSRILLPKVFSTAGNSSVITVVNTSSTKFDAVVSIFDNSSVQISRQVVTMPAYSGFSKTAAELVQGNFSGYATVESLVNFPLALVGMVRYVNRGDTAVLPATALTGGLKAAFIPHFAMGGGYTSRLAIVNPEGVDQSVHLTARLADAFGNTFTASGDRLLSARTRLEEDLTSIFGLSPASLITGYISLTLNTDTPGVASYIEFGTTDGILLSAVPAQGTGYSDYFFSHIAEGMGYYTGLAMANPNAENVPVSIDIIARDGTRVGGTVINLAGGERRTRLMSELIPGTVQLGGYVRVSATRNIFVIELFGSSTSLRFAANVSARGTQVTPLLSGNLLTNAGALVVSADSSASLLIPPSSLTASSIVQLDVIDPSTLPRPTVDKRLTAAVDALPLGTQFDIPTRLTMPIGLHLAPGTQVPLYIQSPLTGFQFRPSEFVATVDESGRNAVSNITHFSAYGVVWPDDQVISAFSIAPAQGAPGATLTITGTGLTNSPGGTTVTFAGPDNTSINGSVFSISNTSLSVVVPPGAVTGNVFVRNGTRSSQGLKFTSLNPNPIPTIASLSPAGVTVGGSTFVSVLVTGTGFTNKSVATVGNVQYPTLYLGPTTLRIEVTGPLPSGFYPIAVQNPGPGGGVSATFPWSVAP